MSECDHLPCEAESDYIVELLDGARRSYCREHFEARRDRPITRFNWVREISGD